VNKAINSAKNTNSKKIGGSSFYHHGPAKTIQVFLVGEFIAQENTKTFKFIIHSATALVLNSGGVSQYWFTFRNS